MRGIENKSPKPKAIKVTLKPLAGVELKWRIMVINDIPKAPPTDRNMPRSPVIVDTFSGINSMQALLEAGRARPMPIPVTMIIMARIPAMLI
jgi:hypothetical protein